MGSGGVPADDPRKDDVGRRVRRADHGHPAPRRPTARHLHPSARSKTPSPQSRPPAARPTPCCTSWPWRARPACPRHRRLRSHEQPHADLSATSSRAAVHRGRSGSRGRHAAGRAAPGRRAAIDGGAMTVTGRSFGEEAALARRPPDKRSWCPLEPPLKPTRRSGHPARHRWRPTAAWSRSPATSATAPGPARVFDCEEDGLRRG